MFLLIRIQNSMIVLSDVWGKNDVGHYINANFLASVE